MDSKKPDLEKFFNPRHIAIVGVPRIDDRFGGGSFLSKFLECGFPGKLYPINPKADEIQGLKAYPDLSSLPETPDLVIISVVARLVPRIIEECGRLGITHVHILSSGFKEIGTNEGRELENHLAFIASKSGIAVIGPNCMGPYCPSSNLTAWGAIPGLAGPVGIISQSGGITQRLTEYLYSLGIGTEKAVSMGNAAVLDSCDYLEFFAKDEKIRTIAMYLESVKDGRKLVRLASEISKHKPIILWKGGMTEAGVRTVASHTGTLAGRKRLWEAFFHQTGVINVHSVGEWVDAIMALCLLPEPKGKAVFIVGGGGGNSVGNGDMCIRHGLDVPTLSETSMKRLREIIPVAGSIAGNPLDEWRTYEDPDHLKEILSLGYDDPRVDMVIVDRLIPRKAFHMTDMPDSIPDIIEFIKKKGNGKPTVFTEDSEGGDPDLSRKGALLRAQLCSAGIPAYPSLARAAWSLAQLHRYHVRLRS